MQLSAPTIPATRPAAASFPTFPVPAPGEEPTPIARAQVSHPGFDPKVFDVVAGEVLTRGHASAPDALRAAWEIGPSGVVGIVQEEAGFAVVDLMTADSAGRLLTGLPQPFQGLGWIQQLAGSPLTGVHVLGDFGFPVELLEPNAAPPA